MIIVLEFDELWHATFYPSRSRMDGKDAMGIVTAKSLKGLAEEIESVKHEMRDDGTFVAGPIRED